MRVAESRGEVQRAVAPLCNTCDFIFAVKKRIFNSPFAVKQQYACCDDDFLLSLSKWTMRESNWTRILARQPGWKYIRTGACSHGVDSSLSCRVITLGFVVVVIVVAAASLSVKGKKLSSETKNDDCKEQRGTLQRAVAPLCNTLQERNRTHILVGLPGWQVTLQPVLAALAVIPVSLAMLVGVRLCWVVVVVAAAKFAGKRLYLYLGVAIQMTGYPATSACRHGDDSSVSCRILGNSQVETHMRISHKSKFEPSITHFMVFGVESSQVEKPITGLSLKSEALERWETRSFKGFLCPSTLFFSSFFNASAGALNVAGGTDAGMLPDFLLVFAAMALLNSLVARAYQRSEPHFLHRFS
ncbi:hypothetical protein KY290_032545 [Solanum tuberosum]|uniref:Uncharacterized protein n=1 Tax=Solanum tuberosum TaxID=4113 RepID=A0ABQ7UCF8_SOLTU|nr:hypothetical protein KY284_029579 [Solanum tuberosum]KAH0744552.1 hypothetical protein KY290_032545 [Solanum tuberosum]